MSLNVYLNTNKNKNRNTNTNTNILQAFTQRCLLLIDSVQYFFNKSLYIYTYLQNICITEKICKIFDRCFCKESRRKNTKKAQKINTKINKNINTNTNTEMNYYNSKIILKRFKFARLLNKLFQPLDCKCRSKSLNFMQSHERKSSWHLLCLFFCQISDMFKEFDKFGPKY